MTTTYADPTRCPDCRAVLPHDPQVCRVCSLPLTGEAVTSLFRTLQEADRILDALRSQKRPVEVVAATTPVSGSHLQGVDPYPAASQRPTVSQPPRVRGSSVPRILLSLGALCLLVAAITFLAFAWSWLGVGGRTTVLVVLTGASLGLSVALLRRGLVTAAESLSVIGLGMLALVVVGARHAGWLGTIDDAQAHPRHRRRGRDRGARAARGLGIEADVRTGPDRSRRRSPGHLRRPVAAGVTPALDRGRGRPPRAGTHRSRAAQHPVDDHLDRDGRPRLAVRRGDGLRHGRGPGHVRPLRR